MGKIKVDDDIDTIQDDIIKTIKNKRAKQVKEQKTYTIGQILRALLVALVLLGIGAYAGITFEKAMANSISGQVKEQVKAQMDAFYIIPKQ